MYQHSTGKINSTPRTTGDGKHVAEPSLRTVLRENGARMANPPEFIATPPKPAIAHLALR